MNVAVRRNWCFVAVKIHQSEIPLLQLLVLGLLLVELLEQFLKRLECMMYYQNLKDHQTLIMWLKLHLMLYCN